MLCYVLWEYFDGARQRGRAAGGADPMGIEGWIGSALVSYLKSLGHSVLSVDRYSLDRWIKSENPCGIIIYCIGLTSDFRQRPHDTVDAHVSLLSRVLQRPGAVGLCFLSSTRIYSDCTESYEDSAVCVDPLNPSDFYNLTKLLGESMVLNSSNENNKVVRLSNVVGPNQPIATFWGSLLADASIGRDVVIRQPELMAKDYVFLGEQIVI